MEGLVLPVIALIIFAVLVGNLIGWWRIRSRTATVLVVVFVAVILALVAGCASEPTQEISTPTSAPAATPMPTPTSTAEPTTASMPTQEVPLTPAATEESATPAATTATPATTPTSTTTPNPDPTATPTPTPEPTPTPTATPAPTRTPTPTPTLTPDPTPVQPISVSGQGTSTRAIDLSEGLWVVDLSLSGSQGYLGIVIESVAVSADGSGRALLFNEVMDSDDWSGSVTLRVGDDWSADIGPGRQIISAEATGSWTLTFAHQSHIQNPTQESTTVGPISVSGEGTSTRTIDLSEGLWIVELSLSGSQGYLGIVIEPVAVSANGSGRALLFNEVMDSDDWSGSVTLRVGDDWSADIAPGRQIISVDATGSWQLTFTRQ